jgi:F-type H+-transporting ATPase subunit a
VNNTLALAIVAFVIIEVWGFQTFGLGYLKKFFNFTSPINAFVGLLELLSEYIRIISFAFRLFGNIFAGEVLVLMLTFLMPFLFVDIIYGLELFVGFIQAAVFALLTLVFGVMAVESHDDSDHHEAHSAEGAGEPHHQAGAAQAH